MILPVRPPRCSVCEQLKAQECSPAWWSPSASTPLDDSRWQSDLVPWRLGTANSPCSGRTDSIYDLDPDPWKLRLDVD